MAFAPVLHSEWIKIRTPRSQLGSLCAVLLATVAFSALAGLDTDGDDFDPLFAVFSGVIFGQIAAIAFGTTAVSSEFQAGALRLSLAAVPDRGRWFTAEVTAIGVPVLAVGLVTGPVSLAVGRAVLGADADGLGNLADFLPDRAGQVALHATWEGSLGPWTGLGVCALWAAALLAGARRLSRRDA
ncbi:ABC transporter permease [Streptomyces sp. HUAS ZL42]|uniref:ABC transporter permease n=1 Tax=Streptomyces sp. HUAS ZL42 TaxID=3231715 RepID=UPI00345E1E31